MCFSFVEFCVLKGCKPALVLLSYVSSYMFYVREKDVGISYHKAISPSLSLLLPMSRHLHSAYGGEEEKNNFWTTSSDVQHFSSLP